MAGLSDSLLGLEGRLSIYMIYTKKVSFSFTNIYIAQNGRFVRQFFRSGGEIKHIYDYTKKTL